MRVCHTLDPVFDPSANGIVMGMAVQSDGRVLLGGFFTTLQPNGAASPAFRSYFARVNNDPATQTLTVPDLSQLLWERGGSAPELSLVNFEESLDGGASWSPLATGSRVGITANWQATELSLSTSVLYRARGRTTGGNVNGSSGVMESLGPLPPEIAVEQPVSNNVADGDTRDFGTEGVGGQNSLTFITPTPQNSFEPAQLAIVLQQPLCIRQHARFVPALQGAQGMRFGPAVLETQRLRDELRVHRTAAPGLDGQFVLATWRAFFLDPHPHLVNSLFPIRAVGDDVSHRLFLRRAGFDFISEHVCTCPRSLA